MYRCLRMRGRAAGEAEEFTRRSFNCQTQYTQNDSTHNTTQNGRDEPRCLINTRNSSMINHLSGRFNSSTSTPPSNKYNRIHYI